MKKNKLKMNQVQVSRMLQDNMMILDTALSAVSSAEKLVFGINEGKKYGYYDENDTASWRSKKELKYELTTKIQCLNGMMSLYSKRYPGQNLQFPDNLSKKEILEDLYSLRDEAMKNTEISKYSTYFTDLINLIDKFKCKKYTVDEILEGTEPNKDLGPRNEEEVSNLTSKFLKISETIDKKEEEFNDYTAKNGGKFSYKFKEDKNKKKAQKNNYFKNFYEY